tara:strand:+ start:25 stop:420 length:396 start_codon:yes stop_codon:yes gene_type:complete
MSTVGILGIAQHVYNTLGHGHSEAVYHRAMEVGLRKRGIKYDTEKVVPIRYDDHVVGHCRFDLVINDSMIIELKAISSIKQREITQLKNYMNMTGLSNGCVINFPLGGDKLEVYEEPQTPGLGIAVALPCE